MSAATRAALVTAAADLNAAKATLKAALDGYTAGPLDDNRTAVDAAVTAWTAAADAYDTAASDWQGDR